MEQQRTRKHSRKAVRGPAHLRGRQHRGRHRQRYADNYCRYSRSHLRYAHSHLRYEARLQR